MGDQAAGSGAKTPIRSQEGWSGILGAIKGPLTLLALVALVTEATLAAIAFRLEGNAALALGALMVIVLLLAVGGVIWKLDRLSGEGSVVARQDPAASVALAPTKLSYDAFIATPMAAMAYGPAFEEHRNGVVKIIDALSRHCGISNVYYAGRHIDSNARFESEDMAIRANIAALRESRVLILIYPGKSMSSCLVEAGMAIALKKPCFFFVRDEKDLPYLLRKVGQAAHDPKSNLPVVQLYEDADPDAIVQRLKNNCMMFS